MVDARCSRGICGKTCRPGLTDTVMDSDILIAGEKRRMRLRHGRGRNRRPRVRKSPADRWHNPGAATDYVRATISSEIRTPYAGRSGEVERHSARYRVGLHEQVLRHVRPHIASAAGDDGLRTGAHGHRDGGRQRGRPCRHRAGGTGRYTGHRRSRAYGNRRLGRHHDPRRHSPGYRWIGARWRRSRCGGNPRAGISHLCRGHLPGRSQ